MLRNLLAALRHPPDVVITISGPDGAVLERIHVPAPQAALWRRLRWAVLGVAYAEPWTRWGAR